MRTSQPLKSIHLLNSLITNQQQSLPIHLNKINVSQLMTLCRFTSLRKRGSQIRVKNVERGKVEKYPHLVKNRNKVERHIGLHLGRKREENYGGYQFVQSRPPKQTSNTPYFTPKTRNQIILYKQPHLNKTKHILHEISQNVHLTQTFLQSTNSNNPNNIKTPLSTVKTKKHNPKNQYSKITKLMCSDNIATSQLQFTQKSIKLENEPTIAKQATNDDAYTLNWDQNMSVFSKYELQSYYRALIVYANNQQARYRQGFQTMLNIMSITASDKIVSQWLPVLLNRPTFPQFVITIQKVMQSVLQQSINDYFQIVFQGYKQTSIGHVKISELLAERMNVNEALYIADQIYGMLEVARGEIIRVQAIFQLCYQNQLFCAFMRQFRFFQYNKPK